MDVNLDRDLKILERAGWEDTIHIVQIAGSIRDYIGDVEIRLSRLDRFEDKLNQLEAEGKTDVLKHFEEFKSA